MSSGVETPLISIFSAAVSNDQRFLDFARNDNVVETLQRFTIASSPPLAPACPNLSGYDREYRSQIGLNPRRRTPSLVRWPRYWKRPAGCRRGRAFRQWPAAGH